MIRKPTLFFSMVGIVAAIVQPDVATAQNVDALVDRIERLERSLRDLEPLVYRGETPRGGVTARSPDSFSAPSTARIAEAEVRMTQLENELRNLTGRIEEVSFRLRQISTRLDKLVGDVDFRLGELERGAGAPPQAGAAAADGVSPPAAPPAATGFGQQVQAAAGQREGTQQAAAAPAAPGTVLPDGSPMERYNFAFSLLRKSEFDRAEQAFTEFLAAHPDDDLAANAQYWLGETFYVRNQFDAAAAAFLQGIKQYPASTKAPDTLLKLGITLRELGQPAEACNTWNELLRSFPDADNRIRSNAEQQKQRTDCG